MPARPFVDTNVLVYAVAGPGPDAGKAERARALLRAGTVCLSTQVLGEFYCAVTHTRRSSPLQHKEALAWVQMWKRHDVRDITLAHVDLALELRARFGISYYDALIVAAARLAGCPVLYSEDLNHGQDYGGVRVENPFRDS
jgi:predicted nucleic acid-binding protein